MLLLMSLQIAAKMGTPSAAAANGEGKEFPLIATKVCFFSFGQAD